MADESTDQGGRRDELPRYPDGKPRVVVVSLAVAVALALAAVVLSLSVGTVLLVREQARTDRARDDAAAENWFAAAFHLRWLAAHDPNNIDLQDRLRHARAELAPTGTRGK